MKAIFEANTAVAVTGELLNIEEVTSGLDNRLVREMPDQVLADGISDRGCRLPKGLSKDVVMVHLRIADLCLLEVVERLHSPEYQERLTIRRFIFISSAHGAKPHERLGSFGQS